MSMAIIGRSPFADAYSRHLHQVARMGCRSPRRARIARESNAAYRLPEDVARRLLAELTAAVLSAVDDLSEVPEDLHPADVVAKYLQRGNIQLDGCSIRGPGQ